MRHFISAVCHPVAHLLRAVLLSAAICGAAQAADTAAPWSWSGGYIGTHAGAALGQSKFSDPYGASIYGDDIRTPGFMLGAQIGYNWQAPGSPWVWGIESDLSVMDADGTGTCFAASGRITSSNCSARPDFTGTLTARLGVAVGPAGRTLLYAKGGGAMLHNRLAATTNYGFGFLPLRATSASATSIGWTLGVGVEQAIAPAWSLKLEYDYVGVRDATLMSPATFSTTPGGFSTAVPGVATGVRQSINEIKLGLNYRFGGDASARWPDNAAPDWASRASPLLASGWALETGARYWLSSGRFQKDLPASYTVPSTLISRLTYDDMTGRSGEFFARLDTPWNVFVKGLIGGGGISGGKMNDEDWGLFTAAPYTAYSNTLSNLVDTKMRYATLDIGVDVLKGRGFKLGAFVGYNHVYEQYEADDCVQIASPSAGICTPPFVGVPVITETDTWRSLRVGMTGEAWLTPQWKVSGDVAYLPYVKFNGRDNHWLRALIIDETGRGHGVQLEAMLSYYLTPQFSIGVGGRYWAMWTTSGTDAFDGVPIGRDDAYRYERYGLLLQGAYKF